MQSHNGNDRRVIQPNAFGIWNSSTNTTKSEIVIQNFPVFSRLEDRHAEVPDHDVTSVPFCYCLDDVAKQCRGIENFRDNVTMPRNRVQM